MNQDQIRIERFQIFEREAKSLQCRIMVAPDKYIGTPNEFGQVVLSLLDLKFEKICFLP